MMSRFTQFVGDLALAVGMFHRLRCLLSHGLSDVVWQFLVVSRWVTPDLGIDLAAQFHGICRDRLYRDGTGSITERCGA